MCIRDRSFVAPDRQYIRLADDVAFPRTDYSLQELKEYALRAQQKRRFWEDLSTAADAAGVHLSRYAYAQGAHREELDTSDFLSPNHDEDALAEGLHREAAQQRRNEAHAARMQSTGTLWAQGHDQPTTTEEILRKHNVVEPTPRPGPAEGVLGAVGETSGAVIGGGMTRTGIGHDLGKVTGGAVGRTTGKVVDAVMNPVGAAAGFVGDAMLQGLGFEPDIPKYVPKKIQQPVRLRKRGDL